MQTVPWRSCLGVVTAFDLAMNIAAHTPVQMLGSQCSVVRAEA
jgi:hypothetical protein